MTAYPWYSGISYIGIARRSTRIIKNLACCKRTMDVIVSGRLRLCLSAVYSMKCGSPSKWEYHVECPPRVSLMFCWDGFHILWQLKLQNASFYILRWPKGCRKLWILYVNVRNVTVSISSAHARRILRIFVLQAVISVTINNKASMNQERTTILI